MKKFLLMYAAILFLTTHSYGGEKSPFSSNKIYIPDGFDTNDIVELTITGTLPDTCHRVPDYDVDFFNNIFSISAKLNHITLAQGCRKMAIPFTKTINLGFLKKGDYQVKFLNQKIKLKIKEASGPLQDDYLYGNVTNIIEDSDSRVLKLIGTNPINCLNFETLEFEVQNDVIVLKPKFSEEGLCEEKSTSFTIDFEVPFFENKPRGILIHVRAMGGRSLNHLFQNLGT